MNNKLIQKLRDGEIALRNESGCLEDLNTILSITFGDDNIAHGTYQFYEKAPQIDLCWDCRDVTNLPSHTIAEFLQDEPKFNEGGWVFENGDLVMANVYVEEFGGRKEWMDSVYIGLDRPCNGTYIVEVMGWHPGISLARVHKKDIRPMDSPLEVTMQEVADKFGVSVEQIKIKQ